MEGTNILSVEFKSRGQYGDEGYEITYTEDKFGMEGAEKKTKVIKQEEFDFIQYHLRNIIGN